MVAPTAAAMARRPTALASPLTTAATGRSAPGGSYDASWVESRLAASEISATARCAETERRSTTVARISRAVAIPSPVRAEQVDDVGAQHVHGVLWDRVDLVEQDEHRGLVPDQPAQVPGVERVVGVLLRVDHPDQEVYHRQQPIHHLAVLRRDRVMIGQVEQDQAAQRRLGFAVERALALEPVIGGDLEPVEQAVRLASPDARADLRRRRPKHAHLGERQAGNRIEQARLARSGAADECHDRVAVSYTHLTLPTNREV